MGFIAVNFLRESTSTLNVDILCGRPCSLRRRLANECVAYIICYDDRDSDFWRPVTLTFDFFD